MKAKEYAAALLATTSYKEYEDTLFAFLDELVQSTITEMKKRANPSSANACVRETFTKWKSIVAQVTAANPDAVVHNALFVKYFSYASPPLYVMALEAKAFLGYVPDAEDIATAQQGRSTLSAMATRERLQEMQREAKAFGLNPGLLVAAGIRNGELDLGALIADDVRNAMR
jgi:hypothetical protein